ncbi:MAG: putative lipid II flippase FtsW [Candidatus Roizmanbacteria bacterium]|nr:putative lipid II flippase FtsW [Candidatus Roizmanbacteria bacterium]
MSKSRSLLLFFPIVLTALGVFMIYEASSINAASTYGDALYFVRNQLIWFALALVCFGFFSRFDYHRLYSLSLPILVINIVLLLLVFIPGLYSSALGASRWLSIGPIRIQPSELTKLTLIVYLSAWFSYKERSRLFAFLILTGLIIGLVMLQPDLGTAAILGCIALFLYMVSGAPIKHGLLLIPLAATAFLLLAVFSPYRLQRLTTFLNPQADPQGIGYHIQQINIALSLGGVWGSGFGSSKQKFLFLPEAHTDSIFAIIGENFGFVGSVLIVSIYIAFLLYIYQHLQHIKDRLGFLLASGVFFIIGFQCLVNLGAMVQLLPLTGIPLPFISYGGSSLLTFYILSGILFNIISYSEKKRR